MKLTNEQKEANKLARAEARKAAKEMAKIEAEKNQKPVKEIFFSIEWVKSRMWGHNPYLEAKCEHIDGSISYYKCKASGCGYDKESQVISEAFNEFLKYRLYHLENKEILPYGISADKYKYFSGGIGVNCYYAIAEAINGTFTKVGQGHTYDCYKFTTK